jgi:hypothetical protein
LTARGIDLADEYTPERLIEGLMLLYNAEAAKTLTTGDQSEFVWWRGQSQMLVGDHMLRSQKAHYHWSIKGPAHISLGLDQYVHATSPLRRWVDQFIQGRLCFELAWRGSLQAEGPGLLDTVTTQDQLCQRLSRTWDRLDFLYKLNQYWARSQTLDIDPDLEPGYRITGKVIGLETRDKTDKTDNIFVIYVRVNTKKKQIIIKVRHSDHDPGLINQSVYLRLWPRLTRCQIMASLDGIISDPDESV